MRMSKSLTWADFRVGLAVMLAAIFLLILLIRIDRPGGIFGGRVMISARIPNLQGLRVGGQIQFIGLEIGQVKQIRLENNEEGKPTAVVDMWIDSSMLPKISVSSQIVIGTLGVLGDKFIRIIPGNPKDPPIEPGGYLNPGSGQSLDRIIAGTTATVDQVNAILKHISDGKGTLGKFATDEQLYDNARDALGNAKSFMQRLDRAMKKNGSLEKLMRDPRFHNESVKVLENLRKATDEMSAKKGSLGKFLHQDDLYENINTLTVEITNLVRDIRENPGRYFDVSVF